jgi:hypothetical protein
LGADYDVANSKRSKSVMKIEKRLTYLAENDPQNEEMYTLLKSLAYIYVNQNKFVFGYCGVDDVCHDIAADVWMSVLGGKKIYAWIYYIGKMIKLTYVTRQKRIEHEIINVQDNPVLKETVKRMCASSSMSCIEEFDNMERRFTLEHIDSVIRDVMSHTKFVEDTMEYTAVYTNVCLNLLRDIENKPRTYFRLSDSLIPYVGIIIEQFKKKVRNLGFTDSIMDNTDADLDVAFDAEYTELENSDLRDM